MMHVLPEVFHSKSLRYASRNTQSVAGACLLRCSVIAVTERAWPILCLSLDQCIIEMARTEGFATGNHNALKAYFLWHLVLHNFNARVCPSQSITVVPLPFATARSHLGRERSSAPVAAGPGARGGCRLCLLQRCRASGRPGAPLTPG